MHIIFSESLYYRVQYLEVTFVFPDFYCKIVCEKEVILSGVDKDVKEPNWDTEAIFYQRRPIKDPLRVEVCAATRIQYNFQCTYNLLQIQ